MLYYAGLTESPFILIVSGEIRLCYKTSFTIKVYYEYIHDFKFIIINDQFFRFIITVR
jgi:hypothetical protein